MTVPSYPAPAPGYPASAPRSRPTTVTVASYLLYAVALIQVINAIAAFATYGPIRDAVRDAYSGTEAEGAESLIAAFYIVGGVINLLLGAGFAALSFFDSKGKNASRIITWVVGGISLCCLGAGLGSNALVGSLDADTGGTGPTNDEIQRRLEDAVPGWYTGLTTTLTVLGLLAILGAVILLALPASNEFFRKPAAAGWDPQYPGGQPQGYYPGQQYQQPPAYPAYPPQQGQPGQPAPGLPPYPGQQTPPPPYPGQQSGPPYPGQPSAPPYPGQPSAPPYPGQQTPPPPYPGQQSAPPYPGQQTPPPPYPGQVPPASDPYAPPPAGPFAPPSSAQPGQPPFGEPPTAQQPSAQQPSTFQPPSSQPPSSQPPASPSADDPAAWPRTDEDRPPKPPTDPA